MCMEDVLIGRRKRYARITNFTSTATTQLVGTINADSRRVAIRLNVAELGSNTAANVGSLNSSTTGPGRNNGVVITVNQNHPRDELWIERHGNLVMGEFQLWNGFAFAAVSYTVTEILQDDDIPPVVPPAQ